MSLESTEELCLMALRIDTKFEGKLTYASKNNMKNLANFHQSTWKSQNWDFHGILFMAGKIEFSGARKSVLLKASSGERSAPRNFVHLVTLWGTYVRLIVYLVVQQMKYVTERWSNANNILQFPHVRADRLSEKRKPRLCFPR